mmetsp:Transcript_411/g.808  ORF Transcript_411/g.808 Transcript_411/m.808 type:complete len:215 (+) Transcript_411:887-1531(+)
MPFPLRVATPTGLLPGRVRSAAWSGKGISITRMMEATRAGETALTLITTERAASHDPRHAEVPGGPPRLAKCEAKKYKLYALPNSRFTGSCINERMCASRRSTCHCCGNDSSPENILPMILYHVWSRLRLRCSLWPSINPSRSCGCSTSRSQDRASFALKPNCLRYGTTSAFCIKNPTLAEKAATDVASSGALRITITVCSGATYARSALQASW